MSQNIVRDIIQKMCGFDKNILLLFSVVQMCKKIFYFHLLASALARSPHYNCIQIHRQHSYRCRFHRYWVSRHIRCHLHIFYQWSPECIQRDNHNGRIRPCWRIPLRRKRWALIRIRSNRYLYPFCRDLLGTSSKIGLKKWWKKCYSNSLFSWCFSKYVLETLSNNMFEVQYTE